MSSSRPLLLIALGLIFCSGAATGRVPGDAHDFPSMKVWRVLDRSETVLADTAFTPVRDTWTGFDKIQHTTFSFLWVLSSQYVLVNKTGWGEQRGLPVSVGLTASLGVAKELYDWQFSSSRHFCWKDLVADLVGVSAAVLLVLY